MATYPYVQSWWDYGVRKGPALGLMLHMAEGSGTVGYLDDKGTAPPRGVSVHTVCDLSGKVTQMLPWDHASGSLNPADRSTDKAYFGHTHLVDVLGPGWTDPNSYVLSMEIEGHASTGPNTAQVTHVIAWCNDMKAMFPTLRGALGHADQTDTKFCPGTSPSMKAIFAAIGGHGLWEVDVVPAPITDETPKIITTAAGSTWYQLDGKTVHSTGHSALGPRPSPYGVGTKRAIYVTGLIVLVVPATVAPVADCTQAVADAKAAQHEADRTQAIALAGQL